MVSRQSCPLEFLLAVSVESFHSVTDRVKIFDVAVCGAGMIGAATACLFARQGLKTALIDQQTIATWKADSVSSRVSALNPASIRLFKSLGIWNEIESKRFCPYTRMVVRDFDSSASISFDAASMSQPCLGGIVENNLIVDSFSAKLQQNYHIEIFENTELQNIEHLEDSVVLETGNRESINCKLLVGADGSQSRVRQLCDIDTRFLDYGQDAIVTTITLDQHHQNTAWQVFLPTGPVALLPLSDGRCSIVWSCDREYADSIISLDDENFCTRLSDAISCQPGNVTHCEPRHKFPLRQHHAEHYIARHTALVGDAAHITHPLAGLGANIGFMDAAALAETIESASELGLGIARTSVLRRYERWRKGENALVLSTMRGFKHLFGSSSPAVKKVRRAGLDAVDRLSPIKHQFAQYAMGLTGDLPEICRNS